MQSSTIMQISLLILSSLLVAQLAAANDSEIDHADHHDEGFDHANFADEKVAGEGLKIPYLGDKPEEKKEGGLEKKEEKKLDILNPLALFTGGVVFGDWVKLMFNPIELVKAISLHFKLDYEKFVNLVGRGLVFGIEAVLTPLVVTLKIVEKVFVPDGCRLKFICKLGTHLLFIKEHVLKFSSNFLEGSHHLKAFTDGIVGKDCEVAFAKCGSGDNLKLKREFAELKQDGAPERQIKLD